MKILFLTENFPPEVNAIASRVFERACYWAKAGHEVVVITCFPNFPQGRVHDGYRQRPWRWDSIDGIRVLRLPTFMARNEGFFLRTLDFLSFMVVAVLAAPWLRRPDVVVATSPQFFAAVAGWLVATIRRRPFVFELADIWPASIAAVGAMREGPVIRMLERLELFLYRRAAAVVALTDAFRANLSARGIPPGKIAVVINGVELDRFSPRTRDQKLVDQLGLRGRFVVGYIGTHGLAHQLDNAIDAAALLTDMGNLCLMFVGDGADKHRLESLVAARGLQNAMFLDPRPKESMPRIWSICDVALVHLRDDPVFADVIPSKIFEAMAMGLPILLAAPEGEASRIIGVNGVGVWVPAARPQLLADAIRTMAANTDQLRNFARRSIAAAPSYSRRRQAQQMLRVLEQVVAGRGCSVGTSVDNGVGAR